MKIVRLILVAAVVGAALSEIAWAIENPAGLATVPPSQLGGGLVVTPNPVDRSGNLVITGNVGGGRQFQGAVPYRSTSEFWGGLGSTSLDSFLRRSYIPSGGELYTRTYQPYYSPTRTVTTTRPNHLTADRFSTYNTEARVNRGASLSAVPQRQSGSSEELSMSTEMGSYSSLGVARGTALETGKTALPGLGTYRRSGDTTDGVLQNEARLEALRRSALSAEQFRTESTFAEFREELRRVPSEVVLERDLPNADQMLGVGQQERERAHGLETAESSRRDGLFQLPRREGTSESVVLPDDSIIVGDGQVAGLPGTRQSTNQAGGQERSGLQAAVDEAAARARSGVSEQSRAVTIDFGKGIDQIGQLDSGTYRGRGGRTPGTAGVSNQYRERAREILGPHPTVASHSRAKFEEHIRAADEYLRRREYYKAADSYRLALVYQKREPIAQAGRGHALFVAGEYMSSALFLSRALETFADPGAKAGAEDRQPKDAAAWLAILRDSFGAIDKDDVENRIVDAEQWRKTSDVGELHFLLAYIYYQMGRAELAKAAIEKAYEKMPQALAVNMLKRAIESAPNPDASPMDAAQTSGQ